MVTGDLVKVYANTADIDGSSSPSECLLPVYIYAAVFACCCAATSHRHQMYGNYNGCA